MYMPPTASKLLTDEPHILGATALATQKTMKRQAQSYRLPILAPRANPRLGPEAFYSVICN